MTHNHLATPDPEFASLFAKLPPSPRSYLDVDLEVVRHRVDNVFIQIQRKAQEQYLPPDSEYAVREHDVPSSDAVVTVRSYVPKAREGEDSFPLMVWCHGGGWVFGGLEQDDYTLKIISVECRISIVNVKYRLAPENPFPKGLEDCYSALKWAKANTDVLNADLAKGFLVAGQSAGANLAAVLAQLAKSDPAFESHPLTGQLLSIPALCHNEAYPEEYKADMTSFSQNEDVPSVTAQHMRDYYTMLQAPPNDPMFSPLLYPSFEGLPPTYIQVCGMDPLRDEGLAYSKKLEKATVPVKVDIYPGVPHGFHLIFPETELSKQYNENFSNAIRWLLSLKV